MKRTIILLGIITLLVITACQNEKITTFEECINAGNPVMESYPRQCTTEKGQTFIEIIDKGPIPPEEQTQQPICINKCGDGKCAEIVCQGEGCPCAETPQNCPEDCK
ncbi:hypothetical protein K9L97_02660 [Candidatus Woesearchaeota archaeon]|nr:hypothetical protein [Candidatus Woesearchaeota archaeon]